MLAVMVMLGTVGVGCLSVLTPDLTPAAVADDHHFTSNSVS